MRDLWESTQIWTLALRENKVVLNAWLLFGVGFGVGRVTCGCYSCSLPPAVMCPFGSWPTGALYSRSLPPTLTPHRNLHAVMNKSGAGSCGCTWHRSHKTLITLYAQHSHQHAHAHTLYLKTPQSTSLGPKPVCNIDDAMWYASLQTHTTVLLLNYWWARGFLHLSGSTRSNVKAQSTSTHTQILKQNTGFADTSPQSSYAQR